mgnify:CR=1 FL=1
MVKILSVIIACILTVLLACMLYPIACLFWVIARVGKIVGIISEWIFSHANKAVKYLWADLRNVSG